ncbi:hypothetical protein BC826DRAFT_1058847 [Russula brevipes]|nr:hypothetical protein BC826DRAFT_1058847 [Russula brevipes]
MLWDCLTLGLVMSLPLCCLSSLWPSQCRPSFIVLHTRTAPPFPPRRTTHSPLHAFSTFAWPPTVRVLSLLAHWYVFYLMPFPKFALWTSYSHGFQVHMALSVW